jgi:hypothetical protein
MRFRKTTETGIGGDLNARRPLPREHLTKNRMECSHMGGDMKEDSTQKALMDLRGTIEGKERRKSRVISKLIGARCEVEDVLLSSSGSSILSLQERLRLGVLMGAIDNIVRRIEEVQ